MELVKAQAMARGLMDENGLSHVPFRFDRARTLLGQTRFVRDPFGGEAKVKDISLSRILTPHRTEHDVKMTILHEIAHAIAGHSAGHGPQWRKVCLSIGGDGKRCGESAPEEVRASSKYIVMCQDGHSHGYRNRVSKYIGLGAPTAWPATCNEHRVPVYLVPNV